MKDGGRKPALTRQQLEIREIDGDMKTLVYENYSKFISATDTIRKVKLTWHDQRHELTGACVCR